MTTVKSSRNSGGFRGYTNEQKTLRAKLAHLLKWTRDLKTNIMKQSCKVLQSNTNDEIINHMHDELDEFKRKLDREIGRIHDICDTLGNTQTTHDNSENLRNEILEALRRSPTYSSLEQHIDDDKRPRIRVKPRERIHPGQRQISRTPDVTKRKASQPIKLQVLDTTSIPGAKRRSQVEAFKRSRSFTNVKHTETQLGMDYIEEDESDLSWKPFGPKKPINNEQSVPKITIEKPQSSSKNDNDDENSSDEEFDIAWERRAKQKARKEAMSASTVESPAKRTVRFTPSTDEPVDLIQLDLDETTQDGLQQPIDQNNNNKQQTEVVSLDDDDDDTETTVTQSQITTASTRQLNNQDDNNQIIVDSDDDDDDDDEIIALSDDEISKTSTVTRRRRRRPDWTTSEIQITTGNSQSQSLHNPYRVGIADPSLRSVFLPPPNPNAKLISGSNTGNKKAQGGNRKKSPPKRGRNSK